MEEAVCKEMFVPVHQYTYYF